MELNKKQDLSEAVVACFEARAAKDIAQAHWNQPRGSLLQFLRREREADWGQLVRTAAAEELAKRAHIDFKMASSCAVDVGVGAA